MAFNNRFRRGAEATRYKLARMAFELEMDNYDLLKKPASKSNKNVLEDVLPWRQKQRRKKEKRDRGKANKPKTDKDKDLKQLEAEQKKLEMRLHWVTKMLTFGDNGHHQLGSRGRMRTKPAHVPMNANPIQISCGPCTLLVLCDDGSLWSCGSSCLGIKELYHTECMRQIPMLPSVKVARVSCGWTDHCACITSNLHLFTWGKGTAGKLGHGGAHSTLTTTLQVPQKVEYFSKNHIPIVEVGCGDLFTVCLDVNGRVFSFGCGKAGKLGINKNLRADSPQNLPKQVHLRPQPKQEPISKRWDHKTASALAAAAAAQEVYSTINSSVNAHYGGEAFKQSALTPCAVSVSCGNMHTCVVTRRGAVYSWGFNAQGQLGVGDTEHRGTPVHVDVNAFAAHVEDLNDDQLKRLEQSVQKRLLRRAVLQVDREGGVLERDALDNLVKGSMDNLLKLQEPKKIEVPSRRRRKPQILGAAATAAAAAAATRDTATPYQKPRKRRDPLPLCARVVQVAAGYNHTLILSKGGHVYSCGCAKFAQLGLGPAEIEKGHLVEERLASRRGFRVDRRGNERLLLPLPVTITRSTLTGPQKATVKRVAAGIGHSVAVTDRGRVVAWGWGESGQLGLGETHSKPMPTFLHGFPMRHSAVGVACGTIHTAILAGRQPSDMQFVEWSLSDSMPSEGEVKPINTNSMTTNRPKKAPSPKHKNSRTGKFQPAYMKTTRAQDARTELLVPLNRGNAIKAARRPTVQKAAQASANRRRRQSKYR